MMSGRNAKTNFPVNPKNASNNDDHDSPPSFFSSSSSSPSSSSSLSEILSAKLRKCCKVPSPSLTCLRLDTENSHIGVWQKKAGARPDSANWVMTVELGKNSRSGEHGLLPLEKPDLPVFENPVAVVAAAGRELGGGGGSGGGGEEEERNIALQMIEELLNRN